ncbi:MAG: KTSC domain-containing protein [Planctomycetes bacterium]|nr:KTSC domain-containing protein [Planctomycetota bacterium]
MTVKQEFYISLCNLTSTEFSSGSVYQYLNVPESVYESLMNAASKGKYLNRNIKEQYQVVRIR